MKISSAFPSNYIKASDLGGKPWPLTIRTCVMEDLGQGNDRERKPILYFTKGTKGLVLNKTNANTISDAYGDDTASWQGKPVEVFPTEVEFKGKLVDGIRLRIHPEAQPEVPATAAPMSEELNDSIPF